MKEVVVETDRFGRVRMDGVLVESDEELMLYKGFKFRFTRACWVVGQAHVLKTKERFLRLGLLED